MTLVLASRHELTLDAAHRVGWGGTPVTIAPGSLARMAKTRAAFERLIEVSAITVYGVTSGYGQHASVRLAPEDRLRHARRPPQAMQANAGEASPSVSPG